MNIMKIQRNDAKQIYAFNTKVKVTDSIEEVQHILSKFNFKGFGWMNNPVTGEMFIAFLMDVNGIDVPVRIDVPQIYYKGKYLEKESFRALVILVKSKITQIDLGESKEIVFLPNIPRQLVAGLLPEGKNVPFETTSFKLTEKREK